MWIYENETMNHRDITYVPGFYKEIQMKTNTKSKSLVKYLPKLSDFSMFTLFDIRIRILMFKLVGPLFVKNDI